MATFTDHTITRDAHGQESIEISWMRQASAGAFLDVLVTLSVGFVILIITGPVIEALHAVIALIGFSVADAGLRYTIIRYRATK